MFSKVWSRSGFILLIVSVDFCGSYFILYSFENIIITILVKPRVIIIEYWHDIFDNRWIKIRTSNDIWSLGWLRMTRTNGCGVMLNVLNGIAVLGWITILIVAGLGNAADLCIDIVIGSLTFQNCLLVYINLTILWYTEIEIIIDLIYFIGKQRLWKPVIVIIIVLWAIDMRVHSWEFVDCLWCIIWVLWCYVYNVLLPFVRHSAVGVGGYVYVVVLVCQSPLIMLWKWP